MDAGGSGAGGAASGRGAGSAGTIGAAAGGFAGTVGAEGGGNGLRAGCRHAATAAIAIATATTRRRLTRRLGRLQQ